MKSVQIELTDGSNDQPSKVTRALKMLAIWAMRSRSRTQLRRMLLDGSANEVSLDIGYSVADFINESKKWFWQT